MRTRPGYYYRQSAVIPWRRRDGRLEVLMITSRKKKRWVFPKGIVEPDLDARASAAKEALEEAGIEGKLSKRRLGRYQYPKWGDHCRVEVFAMQVTRVHDEWQEDFRDRVWLAPEEAAGRCAENELVGMVRSLAAFVDGDPAPGRRAPDRTS